MASKNNPNRKNKAESDKALAKITFYGFNNRFWCASSEPALEAAKQDIRRKMKLAKNETFEVKPY